MPTYVEGIRVLAVLGLVPILWGGNCTPTDPSCDGQGACEGVASPRGRSCINFCAPIWDTSTADPQLCPLDPCDDTAFAIPEVRLCGLGSRCIDTGDPRFGRCESGIGLLEACGFADAAGAFDQCGEGTACLSHTRCSNVRDFFTGTRTSPESELICFFPAREGQECDSNLEDRELVDPATGADARLGCRPCEEGTWCVSRVSMGLPGSGSQCVRRCEGADGAPDDSLCSCGDAQCVSLADPVIRPFSGESLGTSFCQPCLRSNLAGCGETPCCDRGAPCFPSTDPGTGLQARVCCRGAGTTCTAGATFEQCCEGSSCDGNGICQACGRTGDPANNQQCCPGYVAVGVTTGSPTCARCLDQRTRLRTIAGDAGDEGTIAYCSDHRFAALDPLDPTRIDGAFVPSPGIPWPNAFAGGMGGFLYRTAGRTDRVEWDLTPDHRVFMLEGDIRAGVSTGTPSNPVIDVVVMPVPAGVPAVVPLPTDRRMESFRIYDSGACSLLITWDILASSFSAQLHREIASASVIQPGGPVEGFRNDGGLVFTPTLQGTEGEIYGLLHEQDRFNARVHYFVNDVLDCGPHEVDLTIAGDVRGELGFNATSVTRARDALLSTVGCVLSGPPTAQYYDCILPNETGSDTRPVTFERRSGGFYVTEPSRPLMDQWLLENFACQPVRDEYVCDRVPFVREDSTCNPAFDPDCPCPTETAWGRVSCSDRADDGYDPDIVIPAAPVRFARPVDYVAGSRDMVLAISGFEADLHPDGCIPELQVTSMIEAAGRRSFGALDGAFAAVIAAAVGSSATGTFGLDPSTLPACSNADGTPNDDLCRVTPFFGGRRHSCANVGGANLCDTLRIEPRRVNIRPDGIEIVLAEDPGDPQFALMNGRTDPFTTTPVGLCQVGRYAPATPTFVESTLQDGTSGLLQDGTRAFCDPASAGPCSGICQQTGTRCDIPFLAAFGDVGSIPDGATCTFGSCCAGALCAE